MNKSTDHGSPAIWKNNLLKKKKQFVSRIFLFIKRLSVKIVKRKKEYNFLNRVYIYIYIPVCRSARRDGIALTTDTLTHSPSRRATGFSSTHVTNRVSIEGTITRSSSVEGVSEVSC